MSNLDDLEDRTWPQLRECTRVAVAALRKIMLKGDGDAMGALEAMDHILSEDWEGPAK